MTRPESYHLLDMLAEVADPRKKKGCRHPLTALLGVLVVGLLCGHKGYTCIATWKPRTQPGLAQVYEYRIQRRHIQTAEITHQTQYGITSLAPEVAAAADLLKLRRGHSTIENKLHWGRDVIFDEDASQARTGSIPHVMAALRNTALSVGRFAGCTKISKTLREFAARPKLAVKLIQ